MKPFKPKKGERYYYAICSGYADYKNNMEFMDDYAMISMGKCYRTREKAEAHIDEWTRKMDAFFATEA